MVEEGYSRELKGVRFLNTGRLNNSPANSNRETDNSVLRLPLNLNVGDLVEVRSVNEILATLDNSGRYRGLRFTQEMRKYCGNKFKVYKKLRKILIETTGELRTMKVPIVLLERVYCDGSDHDGCDRACFCFWVEEWLDKV